MKTTYTITIAGRMTEKEARLIANLALAVNPAHEVSVVEDTPGRGYTLKPKQEEVEHF